MIPRILIACEFSGVVRDAFAKFGFDVWSCDLLPCERGGKHKQNDVLSVIENECWDVLIGFPPCTDLCVSGARWFKEKQQSGAQTKSIDFFLALATAPIERIAIENPIGIMSTKYREPDQIIQPWQFGHGETKATCLWLKNLPQLHFTSIKQEREQRVWKEPPSAERWKNRSRTYTGIGEEMALQWGAYLLTT